METVHRHVPLRVHRGRLPFARSGHSRPATQGDGDSVCRDQGVTQAPRPALALGTSLNHSHQPHTLTLLYHLQFILFMCLLYPLVSVIQFYLKIICSKLNKTPGLLCTNYLLIFNVADWYLCKASRLVFSEYLFQFINYMYIVYLIVPTHSVDHCDSIV